MTTRTYKERLDTELLVPAATDSRPWLTQLSRRVLRWLELSRERRALAALHDRLLKDVGLDRATAQREAGRWFWDDPRAPD